MVPAHPKRKDPRQGRTCHAKRQPPKAQWGDARSGKRPMKADASGDGYFAAVNKAGLVLRPHSPQASTASRPDAGPEPSQSQACAIVMSWLTSSSFKPCVTLGCEWAEGRPLRILRARAPSAVLLAISSFVFLFLCF
ncbi:hypothetical protein NDU88_001166 [Pleurodeles waltl]|uniref:Uncharacterized protein n=1 Tax=Pleurodeles waltl TaxID=8319 RepID=A0AAV7R7T0_PLEWA|nr:hypothetical protein NDU88_001166 [Pleurodeles waltl]